MNNAITNQPHLSLTELHCGYLGKPVVRGINLELKQGEIGCILGPSGCGKTTVLKAIAGFSTPSQGQIKLNNRILSNKEKIIAPEKRNLGMVYQDYALFPHLNVEQNICFGLRNKSKKEKLSICNELLDLIRLNGYNNQHPAELSGGQQQRVALARSLATNPDVLLLDEPFSGLDVELRRELGSNVRRILKQRNITALLVTHDQEEAFAVADLVGVMHKGTLLQWGNAYNLYHHPEHRFTANFIGRGCFISGEVFNGETLETELGLIKSNLDNAKKGEILDVLIRPDDVVIDDQSTIMGTIENKTFVGTNTLYGLKLASGTLIETMLPSHEDYRIGSSHGIRIEAPHIISFSKNGHD